MAMNDRVAEHKVTTFPLDLNGAGEDPDADGHVDHYLGALTTRAHPTISTSELPGIQSTDMNARAGVLPEAKKPR